MGRKTDVLLRGFRAAKCLTVLKLATARIKVQRNKRSISAKQMRGEIAQLLKTGQDAQVYITKADALIKQENMVAFYDLIDQYCHAIIGRFPMIEMQSNCPIDMKEPIATLIYAAPRCVEISELATVKEAFIAKYGKEFAVAAAELRPDCGVSKQVIELLSIRPATGDMKLKLMKEICAEYNVDWTPGDALAGPSTNMPAGTSQQPAKTKMEPGKATGNAGSSKATFVPAPPPGVNQAGPSNLSAGPKFAVQGSKPEGTNKAGLAAAMEPSKATFVPAPPSRVNQAGPSNPPSRVNQAGPSNPSAGPKFAMLQGGSKPEGTNKAGLAAVVQPSKPGVLATDSSKSSSSKHGLSPGDGAVKANASVSQSVQGAANIGIPSVKPGLAAAGSSQTADEAVFAANAFKINDTKDESSGGASLSGLLKSLKGVINTGTPSAASGSFKEPIGEPVAKSEAYVQPVVDVQEGVSDSDNDSFVSVEEERFEDDAEASSVGGAARRESFGKTSLKASVEVDGHGTSLMKKPSRETRESSSSTDRPHEDGYSKASSKKSSFTTESSQEGVFLKASSKNSLNTVTLQEVKSLRAESRKSSLGEEKASGLIMESLNTGALQEEMPFRSESRKSSLDEDKSSGLTMESLNTGALQQEKPFRAESRKSSLREEKGSVGIMYSLNTEDRPFRAESRKSSGSIMESSHEDIYLRVSSKNSLNSDTVLEEKAFRAESRKNSLRDKKPVEEQSFEEEEEIILMKPQLKEDFEKNAKEGPWRENIPEDASLGVPTETSVSQMLDERYPFEEQTNTATTGDGLQEKGMLEDTSTTETLLVEKLVELKKIVSLSDGLSTEEMPSGAGEEMAGKDASSNFEKLPESVSKHIDSLGALATPDDFAAAAKAIAAEAARLAVLDYAKRISGSGGIPVDLTDLTKLGLDFKGGLQVETQEVRNAGDILNDVIKDEASKVKVPVSKDEGIIGDPAKIGGLGHADMEKSTHSKTLIADDGGAYGNNASLNALGHTGTSAKDEPLQQPDMDVRNDEINPFAINFDKATNARFSEAVEDDSSSWFKPALMSKAGGFVQEEDHLDVFFRRKTPLFDEDSGYSFVKMNPSLVEEKAPYFGYDDKKERISQDKFFVSAPVFDSLPEKQSVFVEEISGSFKSPVFDYGGPAEYDATFSFDDGLDKSVGASVRFDAEPEPSFDKVDEEEEQSTIQKSESDEVGQLKWHSNKPTKASSEETLALDTSLGEDSKFVSKRTRKLPQRVHEYVYSSEIPAQAEVVTGGGLASKLPVGSSSSLMQQQQKEQGRYENLRTKPAESFSYSSDAMGKRPSRSPNRASYDSSKESRSDRWESPPRVEDRLSSVKGAKSPIRPSKRQEMPFDESDEDFYFSEDIGNSSARSSMSRRTTKSPTRMAKQQILPQGYDDDADAFMYSTKPSKMPNFSGQDVADDDTFEEPHVARYKPSRQSDELGRDTAANLRQKPHCRQEDYKSESVHMQYGVVGKGNPASRPSPHRKQQDLEDEDDLAYGYKPSLQVDSRGKGSSSRPLSNRTKLGEEEPHLTSRYDDQGRASSSPLSGRRQHYQLPQEEEQEVSIEQYDQDEFGSMPLSDRRQGGYRKEQQRVPRPRYQQTQDLRLEEENLDSSAEDYEQDQAEQRRPLTLSEQEKQSRRLLAYGQEKQHRPLPLSQQYEEEDRMPRPRYRRKQDLRMEKEDLELTLGDYGRPTSFEQEQDGQETKRRPLPPYKQEKQRRPSPPLYEQEEEYQSMQMPDRRQEERRKEKERMSRPHYGQKQGSRLEKETSDLSEGDYELYEEEQWRTSMLSEQEQGGQERQRRRLPPYRQENQHRPQPPLQQYEEEEEEKEELVSVLLPDRRRREERRKEKERISGRPYGQTQDPRVEEASVHLPPPIEDYEQDQEEPGHTSVSSEQEQYGQEKQRRPSPPYGRQVNSKLGRDNSEPQKQEKILQEQQQTSFDWRQQQSLAEEVARKGQKGRKEERSPSPVYRRQQEIQEEKKLSELSMEHNELPKEEKLQYSTAMPEEKQEQDGQGVKKQPWLLHNTKQESKEERPTSGRKQQSLPKEEESKGQQEKSEIKEQLPARQSLPKDEGVKASQEKPEIKAQPPTRRPPSIPVPPTSPSLESSISDPVILATIPPPVKKPSVVQPAAPVATSLESSISAPSPTSAPEMKVPKTPQKPPNVEDLLANFEALRRARKGE